MLFLCLFRTEANVHHGRGPAGTQLTAPRFATPYSLPRGPDCGMPRRGGKCLCVHWELWRTLREKVFGRA
jgi:hypothetical protein